jgi:hypothetical protein
MASLETTETADESPRWRWAALLVCAGLAVFYTWPFAIHPGSTIAAMIGGDVSISISKFMVYAEEGINPFARTTLKTIGWPDGVGTTPGIDLVSFPSALYLLGGAHTIGSIATHGFLALFGYLLTAAVTAAFVAQVTRSWRAGLVAGVAYGFASHMTIVVWAASTYAHMWLFVLPMWAFWRLSLEPSRRRALIAGAVAVPGVFWTPYFALHVSLVGAACLAVFLAVGAGALAERARLAGLSTLPWLASVAVYYAMGKATNFADVPVRESPDFFEQSAHPLMYLVPGSFSPLWGDGPPTWLAEQVPRAAGANLYLGWSVLLLGLVAQVTVVGPWLRDRKPDGPALAGLMGFAVAAACFVFSLPPKVWGSRIPMPSSLIFEVEPALRAGQRMVMPLMAGTAVLAGLGAWWLIGRLRGRPALAALATALLAAVVLVDIRITPPGQWSRTSPPSEALAKLKQAPDGIVIHYLTNGLLDAPSMRACFVQPEHEKVMANACAILGRSPRLVAWQDMQLCDALADERRQGIRYVIADWSRPDVEQCFKDGKPGRYRVVARDDQVTVLEFI